MDFGEKEMTLQQMNKGIIGPNLYLARPQFHYSLLGGTVEIQQYKVIENRVIPWNDQDLKYDVIRREATILQGSNMGVEVEEEGISAF
ncbi:hypothetical protein [Paenibacillus agri]|uniref:Uncharacterized protein n=1 Tax=Paenibacillus agri TaxID=2744309 RepID=A0A850ETT7_9BACL|nr:hypothetical protein [Paenibacillus agri]NUU62907.1 hypothetical protein [Paenibacillus agri]